MIGVLLLMACAAPSSPSSSPSAGSAPPDAQSSGPKRITAAIVENILAGNREVSRARAAGSPSGALEVERLLNAGMVVIDPTGVARPELAEAVPTVDNGMWKLFPDGSMETHYRIRAGAQWHDGTPFTAEDLVFTNGLWQDRELGIFRNVQLDSVDRVEALDSRTAVVHWKRPFIYADTMFTVLLASPLPKHKLESLQMGDKAAFLNTSFWMEDFVGTGAFRVKEWAGGSHILLQANEGYVLGRPKLDEIEIKIIEDDNTLFANLLAGTVDVAPLERGLALEQAMVAKNQWKDGRVEIALAGWNVLFPQFINPNPAIVTNLQFRRALLHAIDRQQLVDTLNYGFAPVAHSYVSPVDPEYPHVDSSVVKYAYDPRRAAQLIEELGYSKGADGVYRDGAGQRLTLEHRGSAGAEYEKTVTAVSDFWQRLGIAVENVFVPPQRARDAEYVATFPGIRLISQSRYLERLRLRHSSATPLPSNNFTGQNYSRYVSPEFDALIDRYYVTIPPQERMDVVRQVVHLVSDQLPFMGLFYDADQLFVNNRLHHVSNSRVLGSTQAWNAHEWEIR
jgi:peptide/nickel transport system substrate-binding protein